MSSSAKLPRVGCRKKKVNPKPNALFTAWLTEWKNEAKEKGWKSECVFDKALKSLKKYPMPLSSGKECKILQYFGPKICKMLDERLHQHNLELEQQVTGSTSAPGILRHSDDSRRQPRLGVHDISESSEEDEEERHPQMLVHDISDCSDEENDQTSLKKRFPSRAGENAVQLITSNSSAFSCVAESTSCTANLSSEGDLIPDVLPGISRKRQKILTRKVEKAKESKSQYIPVYRSGPYAVLLTLYKHAQLPTSKGFMTKAELCLEAQPLADKSFTVPESMSRYTAWSSVSTLIKKGFVIKESSPARYRLSESGHQLAASLHETDKQHRLEGIGKTFDVNTIALGDNVNITAGKNSYPDHQSSISGITLKQPVYELSDSDSEVETVNHISSDKDLIVSVREESPPSVSYSSVLQSAAAIGDPVDPTSFSFLSQQNLKNNSTNAPSAWESKNVSDIPLYPGSFEIVLCVDNREFYGSQSSSRTLLPDLIKNGVACELRCLHVGDLLWIAREQKPVGGAGCKQELVLNYIIERKRMDDFVHSMTSGRLKEQKFRLRHCGIQKKIFLIESFDSMKHFSISEDRIHQAIANTEIIDGFTVKWTRDSRETAAYLTLMTQHIERFYKNKVLWPGTLEMVKNAQEDSSNHLCLMPFDCFNESSTKSKMLSVKELFAKQLVQLSGLSAEKAKSITEKYTTPSSLLQAYSSCHSEKERENLLSNIKCGRTLRNLGSSISRQVARLYGSMKLL
ncbi:crossover junction endonuclease MUS81-like isoform X2 [Pomacea canaliculata]|uniref:crossover junction endonuclease MUS81-like isoform X2 n=1 Tax=Pomacea canaliculata TaxID=400727 RepID=UPI000D738E58|nr:crossover junction endonuclease MUS81-like isoform X2 [Pomacea canaliculata]